MRKKEIFDLSDHCLVIAKFDLQIETSKYTNGRFVYTNYYKSNDEKRKKKFLDKMEEDIKSEKDKDLRHIERLNRKTYER